MNYLERSMKKMKYCKQITSAEATVCGKNICCLSCEQISNCENKCNVLNENCQYISEVNSLDTENAEPKTDTENVLVEFDSKELEVMTNLASIEKMFKSMEKQHTELKAELLEIMKQHNLKSYENDSFKFLFLGIRIILIPLLFNKDSLRYTPKKERWI